LKAKKIVHYILFPHYVFLLLLLPASVVLLVHSMAFVGTSSVIAYISYFVSAYTLIIWCVRIPMIIRLVRSVKENNRFAVKWFNDVQFRINLSLYGSVIWNLIYAVFQLVLGIYHSTFWFISLSAYYFCLCVIRFYFVNYTRKYKPGEKMLVELKKYRLCGIIFLLMNLALSLMIFFMVYWGRTFNHHEITAIAMAAFTFSSLTIAIVNVVKYRKYNSPIYSATKIVSLAAACVSMLTLESTMFTAFGDGTMSLLGQRIMLGTSGGAVSVLIIVMSVYMIRQSNKRIKKIIVSENNNGK